MIDWDHEFMEARANGGLLVSKVQPPWGKFECDHKDSVWDHHRREITRCAKRHGFIVGWESRNVVQFSPSNELQGRA